ncbi:MAG TPA: hypothetical protein P5076_25115, partial [Myxococcota bacterium]|nr:hypothetical protein [Myxococcota bacterium]
PLEERTAARTFELPLDAGQRAALEDLQSCLRDHPDREPPCACDHLVQVVSTLELRVDYKLTHLTGEAASVEVWVGAEAEPGWPDPDVLPDRPRVEVFAFHLHRLGPGEAVVRSFSEGELTAAELAWSAGHHPACEPPSPGQGPAPLAWLLGASLPGEEQARVELELTVRVREGG